MNDYIDNKLPNKKHNIMEEFLRYKDTQSKESYNDNIINIQIVLLYSMFNGNIEISNIFYNSRDLLKEIYQNHSYKLTLVIMVNIGISSGAVYLIHRLFNKKKHIEDQSIIEDEDNDNKKLDA